MSARDAILSSVRQALRDVPNNELPDDYPIPRAYRHGSDLAREAVVDLFVRRVSDYRATVHRTGHTDLVRAISQACRSLAVARVVIPRDLPAEWLPTELTAMPDNEMSADELDAIDGALTSCACVIAETGTIVLDGGTAQGRRIITLVPDAHICVVREEQIVATVPEAISRLAEAASEGRPMTFISGPSATSDIELNRVEGVHGPRNLVVVVIRSDR